MDVSQRAPKRRYPELHCVFGEGLARDVEPQVAASHEVDDEVAAMVSNFIRPTGTAERIQVLNVLEAVAQIAEERVPQVL
jgi:hypothetical protein